MFFFLCCQQPKLFCPPWAILARPARVTHSARNTTGRYCDFFGPLFVVCVHGILEEIHRGIRNGAWSLVFFFLICLSATSSSDERQLHFFTTDLRGPTYVP